MKPSSNTEESSGKNKTKWVSDFWNDETINNVLRIYGEKISYYCKCINIMHELTTKPMKNQDHPEDRISLDTEESA